MKILNSREGGNKNISVEVAPGSFPSILAKVDPFPTEKKIKPVDQEKVARVATILDFSEDFWLQGMVDVL